MYSVGIDLGTTNSVVAVFRKGRKETVPVDGKPTVPSVVSFRKNQPPLVGHAAKARLLVEPQSTVASAKRFMGDRNKTYYVDGSSYSPVDIAALVLRRLVKGAATHLQHDVFDAVLTVPAYFTDDQKADTRRAGEQAGLNVLRLLTEPSAAAISYGLDKGRDQTIMVYDLGGGTFDISILRVQANTFKVVAVGGNSRLGGDDFDELVVAWAAKEFQRRSGIDVLKEGSRELLVARQRLKEKAEEAKKELSQSDSAEIVIPDLCGKSLELELRLDEFDRLTQPLLQKTTDCMHRVLRDAKLTADGIDRVILVGGSTRMRAVKALVTREIKEPYSDESPDEAVAWGAAVVALSLSAPEEDSAPDICVQEATAHSIGIDLLNERHELVFEPLIRRNTNYPCEAGILAATVAPNQSECEISVFRGEEANPSKNQRLGSLHLPISMPKPHQVPVVCVFKLDGDGILHFEAVDIPTDRPSAAVRTFLEGARARKGEIDIRLFDTIVAGGACPEPVEIKVDILG
jgi:molecular chaperone DnaK (HSP70)